MVKATKEITEIKISADDKELIERLQKNNFEADEEFLADFKKKLLECDNERAGLPVYPENILTELNMGHWDLWDYNESIDSDFVVKLPEPVYARNPIVDVVHNVVSIDFGTENTAVSYRDGAHIIPINVSGGNGYSGISDYVNPTVMYFINFGKFLNDYYSKSGRPNTSFDDLCISYSALNALRNATEDNYFSFFKGLKSWCVSNEILKIKDREGQSYEFKPFFQIGENDLNPLEYYAYLLGLYINNMHSGKIFMKYNLSFSVLYTAELRKKIMDSFERGIKKSFPDSLLNDPKYMKIFRLNAVFEEPVAYALTALEKFNFKPKEGEEFYYSVFDFGSETTDFDFGVYCGIPEEDDDIEFYDYQLAHFGASGVRNFGGESLLKYLAFEIFKINADKLLENGTGNKIQFTTYEGCSSFDSFGLDTLINNNSVYAKRNMYELMEKLRWAWEGVKAGEEALEEDYYKGSIYLDLYKDNGEMVPNFELSSFKINEDGSEEFIDLQELLHDRIVKAVDEFFMSMKHAFKYASENKKYGIKDLEDIREINIFLAGSFSKSTLFHKILYSYFSDGDEFSEPSSNPNGDFFNEFLDSSSNYSYESSCKAKKILGLNEDCNLVFNIYPLLGTAEARKIQRKREYNVDINDKTEPNGDTAISYGLLMDRVKVELIKQESCAMFQFYIGKDRRSKFVPALEKGSPLGEWRQFSKLIENKKEYSFYYTPSSKSVSGNMDCREAMSMFIYLDDPKNGSSLYIRPIAENTIEWRVVKDENELNEDVRETNLIRLEY